MFPADAELVAIESELPDGSYLTGNKGGGRIAANNSSSDIALGAYSSSKDWVIRNLPQNLHAAYKKRARLTNLSTIFTLFARKHASSTTHEDSHGFRNP